MKDVVIVDGARTAIGSFGKAFQKTSVSSLGSSVLQAASSKSGIDITEIDEAVFGSVGQFAENAYLARVIAITGGMRQNSTAQTVNRLCGSGLQAIITGARSIQAGDVNIVVAGGAENMSQYPFYSRGSRWGIRLAHTQFEDGVLVALADPFEGYQMGVTAENLAKKFGITRLEQDEFAMRSHKLATCAINSNKFKDEIVPFAVKVGRQERTFGLDEHVRQDLTMEVLSSYKPAFVEDGTVTAGNSSGINDGAAAVIMMSADEANSRKLKPKARFVDFTITGIEPSIMGYGPVDAIQKVLKKTGLGLHDIGLIELNEAFAAQALAVIRGAELNIQKVNVNGGAIAHGHPIGATGAILTVKLINEMQRSEVRYGMVTMCIGGGQGIAAVIENLS